VTTLVLCRHADPAALEQARQLAERLASVPFAAVYSSPLERAIETARMVAQVHDLVPIQVDALREIDFGKVEGLSFEEFPVDLQDGLLREPTTVRFPAGETYEELRARVTRVLDAIVAAHPEATVAVVSHAGAIRAALAAWLGIADEAIFRIDQRYAAVNVVDWLDGVPLVRLVNGTHL
jgi:broad specificity phosphatase PhoE